MYSENKPRHSNLGLSTLKDIESNIKIPKHDCLQNCSSHPCRHLGYIMVQTPHLAKYGSMVQLSNAIQIDSLKAAYSSVVFNSYNRFGYVVYGMMSRHSS